jgi:hypothetical protein
VSGPAVCNGLKSLTAHPTPHQGSSLAEMDVLPNPIIPCAPDSTLPFLLSLSCSGHWAFFKLQVHWAPSQDLCLTGQPGSGSIAGELPPFSERPLWGPQPPVHSGKHVLIWTIMCLLLPALQLCSATNALTAWTTVNSQNAASGNWEGLRNGCDEQRSE